MPPSRALITGISGFAGGYLARHLLDQGEQVLGCSPDGRWMADSPPDLAAQVELAAWDVGREEWPEDAAWAAMCRFAPTALYHLAALSVPDDCGADAPTAEALAVNVEGTRRALAVAARLESRPRVLLTSSSHVYAPLGDGAERLTESSPLGPVHAYGRTKLAAEELARQAVAYGACDALIARPFQHTGPRQNPRMMLPEWCRQLAEQPGQALVVRTLDAHIDLSDVRDVVRAYRLLMHHGASGQAYNIGSGVARRSGDVLDLLCRAAAWHGPIQQTKPGVRRDPIADAALLARSTGWTPQIPLQQTVADTWAWWRDRVAPA